MLPECPACYMERFRHTLKLPAAAGESTPLSRKDSDYSLHFADLR